MPHQPAHPLPTAPVAVLAQPAHYAWAAVFLPAFAMRRQDQRLQSGVGLNAGTGRAALKSGRKFSELKTILHPPDHPAGFKEAEYLKVIYLKFA